MLLGMIHNGEKFLMVLVETSKMKIVEETRRNTVAEDEAKATKKSIITQLMYENSI